MIGQTLSHFKITAKLGREVAIEVLPEAVAECRPGDSLGVPAAEGRTAPRESPDGPPLHLLAMELAERLPAD